MRTNGFTLIELMIVVAIAGLLGVIIVSATSGKGPGQQTFSFGINGITETRCMGGYLFLIGASGSPEQIRDDKGAGVKCE